MNDFPHELASGDVYFSPILVVVIISFFLSAFTTLLLNKFKLSQFVYYPSVAFLAIMTLYIVLIDKFFIHI
jgi:uncharacterized protein DUF1656